MEVEIDERIPLKFPSSLLGKSGKKKSAWIRRAILRAVWSVRMNKVLNEGYDILNVIIMPDCIELHLKGTIEVMEIPDKKLRYIRTQYRYRHKGKDGKEEEDLW